MQIFNLQVGEIPATELDSRVLPSGGMTDQQSCKLETLSRESPYSRVGPSSRKNPSSGVWNLLGLRVRDIQSRKPFEWDISSMMQHELDV